MDKKDQKNCKQVLKLLDLEDLLSLKNTVTNGKIASQTRREATDLIVQYSKSPEELFQRRKMTRDILFRYLHDKGERMPPSVDKDGLIVKILQVFDKNSQPSKHSQQVARITQPSATIRPSVTQYVQPARVLTALPQVSQPVSRQIFQSSSPSASTSVTKSQIQFNSTSLYQKKVNENVSNTDLQLSLEFIQWYFPMINSGIQNPQNTEWSCNHFWPDCKMKLIVKSAQINMEESYDEAALTFSKLDYLVKQEGILFNVNDTPNGHRGVIDPYGLAKVASCGTIHRFTNGVVSSNNVGVFKQLFGLIRDPTENNRWKIKFTQLFLQLQENCSVENLSDFIQNESFD